MNALIFNDIAEKCINIYSNLFFSALKYRIDIWKTAIETKNNVSQFIEKQSNTLPLSFSGLSSLAIIAKGLGSSLFDVLYMTDAEKISILENVLEDVKPDNVWECFSQTNDSGNSIIYFDGLVPIEYNSYFAA